MPVFLKQYGAQRTGTNYLRTLLQTNYADAHPLMHVLGDKHSPPAPFEALWQEARTDADPPLAFVRKATFLRPALTTSRTDPRQQEEVRRLAPALTAAWSDGTLGFLISIKDPYAWILSVAVWEKRIAADATLGPDTAAYVVARCRSFNDRYRTWLELSGRHPSRSQIVRHEELVAGPERVLEAIAGRFGLQRSTPSFVDETAQTEPVLWDHDPSTNKGVELDRSYYLEERYLDRLSAAASRAVTATIDWELMRSFGYSREDERHRNVHR